MNVPPLLLAAADQWPKPLALIFFSSTILYLAVLAELKGFRKSYIFLTLTSIAAFCANPILVPMQCAYFRFYQREIVDISIMKALDLFARRDAWPRYTASKTPPSARKLAKLMLSEWRHESFTPNRIRVSRDAERFSEPLQLAIHAGIFAALQAVPAGYPTVLAFEMLLLTYLTFTAYQLCSRHATSPALFGAFFRADSLAGFWSDTWHSVFTSPCESLAYKPTRNLALALRAPSHLARGHRSLRSRDYCLQTPVVYLIGFDVSETFRPGRGFEPSWTHVRT
ncbi:MAG: hypothetical protein M1833_003208 [Piccolia ochrophora]|nr:MAG: hypothetical protein M1833_003208 [Piccolia ochrophora]